jgi:uncharacterized membrane protein YdjX (TVP38/TMEM64 family)
MEKSRKIKLILGIFYIVAVSAFIFFFFSKFTIQELTSYNFIKNNRNYFFDLRESNLFLLSFIFVLGTILWVLAAGFGLPVALLAGFIFGKWIGTILLVIGMSIGATLLYILGNYYLKEFIRDKFLNKFHNLEIKFKKSEFIYLLIYRFIGGVPFAISNVLPCIFKVKTTNFFWATFIGLMPQLFLIVSIGSGLENIIEKNLEAPRIKDLIFSQEIYIPFLLFLFFVLITILARKKFYKK